MHDEDGFTTEVTEGTEGINGLTQAVIGSAIRVHRELGPGLLESAYQACLAWEFEAQGIRYRPQAPVPVRYRGHALDTGYLLDFVVEERLVVEIKAVAEVHPIHKAQLLSYLRLTNLRFGLLINFHVDRLYEGVTRLVHN